MSVGVVVLLMMGIMLIFWFFNALFYRKLYGEKKVICASCKRKVTTMGTERCPKCKGILYDNYYNDKFYK